MSSDRRRSIWAPPLAAAVSALGLFTLLTANVLVGGPSGWDRLLFRHLYTGESDWVGGSTPGQDNPALNAAQPIFDLLADNRTLVLLVVAVVVTLALLRRGRAAAFFIAAVAITALVPFLKQLVDRPSPFPMPGHPSFPSGHAIAWMAAAAGVVALVPSSRWRWLAVVVGGILVFAVGVAVVADSGHWPSDVVAGWCLAFAWVAVLSTLLGDRIDDSPERDRGLPAQAALTAGEHRVEADRKPEGGEGLGRRATTHPARQRHHPSRAETT